MSAIVWFDMKRTVTRVSANGVRHILDFGNATKTLCGHRLTEMWYPNHNDLQPNCLRCIAWAVDRPLSFHFTKRVTPL